MANKRQKKKKKSSQAAKNAAVAAYKGKNAPVAAKATPAKKAEPAPQPPKAEKAQPKKEKVEPSKANNKPIENKKKPEPKKAKADNKKAKAKAKKNHKPKFKFKFKFSFAKFKGKAAEILGKIGLRKTSAVVLAVSVVIALVSVTILISSLRFSVPKEAIVEYMGREVSEYSSFLVTDDLGTQYEFTDNMKRKGDTKRFRYYAATELIFPEKHSTAVLNLVNVFDNDCVLVASIVDDVGNIYYQSLGLPAGYGISDISISNLKYGTHDLKLVVAAYDPESYKHIGTQYSDITVQVGIEEETTNVEESSKDKE